MVWINGYILLDLCFVNTLKNRQSVANASNAHFLQLIMLQRYQRFTNDFVFCYLCQSSRTALQNSRPTQKCITILPQAY